MTEYGWKPPIRLMVVHRKAGVTVRAETMGKVTNMPDAWIWNAQSYDHNGSLPGIDTCECGKEKFELSERCIICEYSRVTTGAMEYFDEHIS